MELLNLAASRPAWYDRNPLCKVTTYNAGAVAPHADVLRWSYTVPAAKKFQLQLLTNMHIRQTVAAPAATVESYCVYTAATGGSGFVTDLITLTNAIGDGKFSSAGFNMTMLTGDNLSGHTQDLSTGGTCLYTLTMQGVEYDA